MDNLKLINKLEKMLEDSGAEKFDTETMFLLSNEDYGNVDELLLESGLYTYDSALEFLETSFNEKIEDMQDIKDNWELDKIQSIHDIIVSIHEEGSNRLYGEADMFNMYGLVPVNNEDVLPLMINYLKEEESVTNE